MAIKFGRKKGKQRYAAYTAFTAILLCVIFLCLVGFLYNTAEEEAYEMLHVQTKQIKDDITLQLISDRENLTTMANFAAKLYTDGESYELMFESFKPIGLIENIGILNPDNVFETKTGTIDLDGLISFEEEAARGTYISGRVKDLTRDDYEIIRTAVPIRANGETVGVLYGVILLDKIGARYSQMAEELDAQLFVYDKENGDLVIDTVHRNLGNISFLKDRQYNNDYSYEQMATTDKGFTSFLSAYKNENMHLHYSTIEDIGWMIAFARYDSQVFTATRTLTASMLLAFLIMIAVIVAYILVLMTSEQAFNAVTACASDIRKILLETSGNQNHIAQALKQVCVFAKGGAAVFFDTDGEEYNYLVPGQTKALFTDAEKKYFMQELFHYAAQLHEDNKVAVNILCIQPNKHLRDTNPALYECLKSHDILDVSYSATISKTNHITVLAVINAKRANMARMLAEKIAACFSMALYNRNYLNRTKLAATTDGLTGAFNRVAYKTDLDIYDSEKSQDFSCIYVDVNELHICNNKYGHAAGDEMLIYIANTLKDVFFGHKVYRMGGDEFVVFCRNATQETVKNRIEVFEQQLKLRNYHVAIGMSYRTQNNNTEEMVKEAEVRMYEAKAKYYQNREVKNIVPETDEYVQVKTGMQEIDTMLSVLKENYNGIYRVSLTTDHAKRILMPAYLGYNEHEERFTSLFSKYVAEAVSPDYHRAMISFMNYEALIHQLEEGKTPNISYQKINGEHIVLSVYKLCDTENAVSDTLWVFAKK